MGGYGNAYKGYSTHNGLAPKTENCSKTSYASDHVCKPVIVDAEGKKHPIVSYNPSYGTESYVEKTETIVQEHVHSPFVNGHQRSSHPKVEPLKDYGHVEDKWHKSSSPVHGRPHKVEEFLTKVKTEVSQPKWSGLLSPSYWRRTPNSTGHHGHDSTGYGDPNNKSSNGWNKPSGNTIRNGDYDDHSHNNHNRMEPSIITAGGWARPSRAGWAAPPDVSLSKPTNDISTAMEYLKEAAKPPSVTTTPHSLLTVPTQQGLKEDYGQTIDSREAARRYANFRPSFEPEETYTATIDSREAARKYKGTTAWK